MGPSPARGVRGRDGGRREETTRARDSDLVNSNCKNASVSVASRVPYLLSRTAGGCGPTEGVKAASLLSPVCVCLCFTTEVIRT